MKEEADLWRNIVMEGTLTSGGMPMFNQRRLEDLVGRILSQNLSPQIGRIVRQEAAVALAEVEVERMAGGTEGGVTTSTISNQSESSEVRALGLGRQLNAEIIETFDPDSVEANVDRWLMRIDQLSEVHGWTPYERVAIMQQRLRGQAKSWFNRLDSYDYTWAGWKEKLQAAFPRRREFVAVVRECLNRQKRWDESMTHYYQEKLALCKQCRITGEDAVSFIIDGLPEEFQTNARAQRAKTPEELYTGYLVSINDYVSTQLLRRGAAKVNGDIATASAIVAPSTLPSKEVPRSSSSSGEHGRKVRCYNCQKVGSHFSRDCPQPKKERCMSCGQTGHTRATCRSREGHDRESLHERAKRLRLVSTVFDKCYKKIDVAPNAVRFSPEQLKVQSIGEKLTQLRRQYKVADDNIEQIVKQTKAQYNK